MGTILFVCTGNYYRSRFAELLFNHLAAEAGLGWRADSRGTGLTVRNVGPISPHAVRGLEAVGIGCGDGARHPLPLTAPELLGADLVVAMSAAEHRAPLERLGRPACAVEYWEVGDVGVLEPAPALAEIGRRVRLLVGQLRAGASAEPPGPG
jgi:protein-tyrosine phosphatase